METSCYFAPLQETISDFLVEEGLGKDQLPYCSSQAGQEEDCPCSSLIQLLLLLYNNQPSENAAPLLELLADMFTDTYLFKEDYHPKLLARNSYFCPELNVTMYQSCGITSCTFHTPDKDWCNNCILHYMTKEHDEKQSEKITSLSYNELTILLGVPTGELRKCLNSSFSKLRQSTLQTTIEDNVVSGRQYRVLSSSICPVCEEPITPTSEKIVKKGLTYCSLICAAYKPPQILKVEQEFQLSIKDVIKSCLNQFSSLTTMCDSLNISQDQFLRLCETYNLTPPTAS